MKKLTALFFLFYVAITNATTYYVSSAGNDANNGTSSATPWLTVNAHWATLQPGDIVRLKMGETFGSITVAKSGTSGNPIRFATYGSGAKPIISGLSDVSAWTSLGSNLWQSTSAASTLSTLNMVLINGSFAPIGKWPTVGYDTITAFTGGTSLTGKKLTASPSYTGATVVIRKNHWVLDKSTITSHSGAVLNFTNPTPYNSAVGYGYFVQNDQDACDVQNEWWYDAATKKIGIYSTTPPSGVQVSSTDILVNIGAFSWLRFDSIEFKGSNSAAVSASTGNNIQFEACDFNYQGMNGFTIQPSAHHFTINGCSVERTNNNFIYGGGSQNWIITNNTIHNTAQVAGMGNSGDGQYIGMYNVGSNSLIQFNTIKRTGYIPVDFRGSAITVDKNYIDTFCNVKDDGGGIYTWTGTSTTTYTQRAITNNIIGNGGGAGLGTNTTNSDAFGIYPDDNTSQVTIDGNTVFNCGSAGLFLHAAHDLIITNNTFYNNVLTGGYGSFLHIYPGAVSTDTVHHLIIKKNKFINKASTGFNAYLKTGGGNYAGWATGAANIDSNFYCRPLNDATATNTFQLIKTSGNQTTNLAGWSSFSGYDVHSKKSPVTVASSSDIRFEFNPTNSPVGISLGGNSYVDVTGAGYSGTLTLPAFGSAVLLRTGAANSLPSVSAGPDQTITLPTSSVTMAGSATDADGTISSHTWSKVSGPAATITTPSSYTTTITGLSQGTYVFQLSATDNSGGTNTDVMQVTVNPAPNTPPTANAGTDKAITLPTSTVTLIGSGSDADGTISAYQWSQVSGPSTATIVSAGQSTTSVNNFTTAGTYVFRLTVTDNQGATGTDDVNVFVSPAANQPPVVNAGPDQNITGTTATFAGSATDADGTISSHTWSFISGPVTPTITTPSSYTSTITGMSAAGSYTFVLSATDNGGATSTDAVVIQKTIPNIAPVANAGTDKAITLPTSTTTLSGSGSDADGTIAAYNWSQVSGPSTATIVSASQATTVINNLTSSGTYVFRLQVTDNAGATNTDDANVVVSPALNQPPVVNAGPDQTLTSPASSSTFAGSATDADGTISSHTWSFISGPVTATITTPSSYTSTVTGMNAAGSYTFQLSATDNGGATTTDNIVILVNPAPNIPPIANAGPDQIDTLPNPVTLDAIASTDPDGTITGYLWRQISGANQVQIFSATQRATVVNGFNNGQYKFELKVTDNNGATDLDTVLITVESAISPQPNMPTVNAGPNYKVYLCGLCGNSGNVTVTATAIPGGYPVSNYQWIKISGPAATIVSPNSATTLINGLTRGTYLFKVIATDENGGSSEDTMMITVKKQYLLFGRNVIITSHP